VNFVVLVRANISVSDPQFNQRCLILLKLEKKLLKLVLTTLKTAIQQNL